MVDSRESDGGVTVRRRRQCVGCSRRFTTYERPETSVKLMVVKKDGSRVPFDRNKILSGLEKACYKRRVSEDQLLALLERVEEVILAKFDREVPSKFVGQQVADGLQKIDEVAFVRFASVYREFRDVGEFIDEARGVIERTPDHPGQRQLFEE